MKTNLEINKILLNSILKLKNVNLLHPIMGDLYTVMYCVTKKFSKNAYK